jgi:putative membrane protein insertion efficiency factor
MARFKWSIESVSTVRVRIIRGVAVCGLVTVVWFAQPIALGAVHLYQQALAPIAAHVGLRCRFTPSCSRYAEVVIVRDGIARGGWKAITRIARCGPWIPQGTRDDP